jgi:succinate dehydrogenase / fumarate reductase membrane anchor subunit
MNHDLRTNLAKTRNLRSSRTGSHHWWQQRYTAIIIFPIFIWLIILIKYGIKNDYLAFIKIISKPYNIALIVTFVLASFYHAMLGMRAIIEDYVYSIKSRNVLIVILQTFCIITSIFLIIAILYIMILGN